MPNQTLARPRLPAVRAEARQRLGGRYPRHHRHRRSHSRAHSSQGHPQVGEDQAVEKRTS